MSQYRTISSDYRVLKVDHNDKIIEQIFANNLLYRVALMEMVNYPSAKANGLVKAQRLYR